MHHIYLCSYKFILTSLFAVTGPIPCILDNNHTQTLPFEYITHPSLVEFYSVLRIIWYKITIFLVVHLQSIHIAQKSLFAAHNPTAGMSIQLPFQVQYLLHPKNMSDYPSCFWVPICSALTIITHMAKYPAHLAYNQYLVTYRISMFFFFQLTQLNFPEMPVSSVKTPF